jgi:hypothetical protein
VAIELPLRLSVGSIGVMSSFLKYQLCLLRVTLRDFKWVRDLLISTAIAAISTAIQYHWHLIGADHRRAYWISVVGPYAVVLGVHVAWKRFTASWKVHKKQVGAIADKDLEIAAFREKSVPRFRVSEVIARPIPTNLANDNRIYVQIVLESLSDVPVINCRGFLKTIWRRTEAGEWEKTQADELLDLLWSVKDTVVHTIPPRSVVRLNLLWFGSLNQHINLSLERTPHYVLPIVQTKNALKFDVYITADDCPPADVSIEVQKGSEWDNPRYELLTNDV